LGKRTELRSSDQLMGQGAKRIGPALVATLLALSLVPPAWAGKAPPPVAANPQVAYVASSGKVLKLYVADETGANVTALFTSATPFSIDLAPRSQRQIAVTTDHSLQLLTFTQTSTGTLAAVDSPMWLAPAKGASVVDFSPDGRRIAYSCCDGGGNALMVYDLDTGVSTMWATGQYVWDVAWFRNGASLAFSTSGAGGRGEVYEINQPGGVPQLLFTDATFVDFDSSRTNPDALVLNYHDNSGKAFAGLWQAPTSADPFGGFLVADLTNRSPTFKATMNCDDQKLAYMGSTTPSGGQVYFIRNLLTAQETIFQKLSNIQLQFWPTCS
jgi:WD40 repeat protein